MSSQIEIIQTLFNIHREDIPRIYHSDFENLEKLNPGMDGTVIKMVLENLDVINDGRILVVSGPIGCGKTFAAFILTLWREWIKYVEPDYQKLLQSIKEENWNDFEDENIETVVNHPEDSAYKIAISNYYKWTHNKVRFKFHRAFDILKDAIRTDSRALAKSKQLVIIDDLGREYFTDRGFGIAEWDAFFDIRYSELYPTLITTNMTPEEFTEKYNERIYDRLKQIAEWITIKEKSMRRKP